jgi:hypothetical protein
VNQEYAAQAHAYALYREWSNRKKQKGRDSGTASSMQRDVERCPPHVNVNERFEVALLN